MFIFKKSPLFYCYIIEGICHRYYEENNDESNPFETYIDGASTPISMRKIKKLKKRFPYLEIYYEEIPKKQ